MERRDFIRFASAGGVLLGGMGTIGISQGFVNQNSAKQKTQTLTVRPYQLLCAVCAIGEENSEGGHEKINLIRENPDIPVVLVCNSGDVFAYQDPGPDDDADGSTEFNRKRDLEILQRLDLPPGITLPARIILHRLWDRIKSVSGICNFGEVTSDAWKGCPRVKSCLYEKGREICLSLAIPSWRSHLNFSESDLLKARNSNALIIPRTKEERAQAKKDSLEAMYIAEAISIRPHIIGCAVCQYGIGSRPPYETDNLPEMLQFILKNPNAKIKLVDNADRMMCAPCPSMQKHKIYDFAVCVNGKGCGGLTSQLRDVRVLQTLGLQYGDVVNARELYRKFFERITSTVPICGTISSGVQEPSVWWSECGHHSVSLPEYIKGREELIKEFGFTDVGANTIL
jgi:hypothetical protein